MNHIFIALGHNLSLSFSTNLIQESSDACIDSQLIAVIVTH